MTTPRLLVLQAMLDDPGREWYGRQIAHSAGLEPGTIYPILVAFENAGWVSSRVEEIDVHVEGRPRRRYYILTAAGVPAASQAVARATRRRAGRPTSEGLAW